MSVTPITGQMYPFNSQLERHLIEDHYVDEGLAFGADRGYQVRAHRVVHEEDHTEYHEVAP